MWKIILVASLIVFLLVMIGIVIYMATPSPSPPPYYQPPQPLPPATQPPPVSAPPTATQPPPVSAPPQRPQPNDHICYWDRYQDIADSDWAGRTAGIVGAIKHYDEFERGKPNGRKWGCGDNAIFPELRNELRRGEKLPADAYLASQYRDFLLTVKNGRGIVFKRGGTAWLSGIERNIPVNFVHRNDGNLVVEDLNGNVFWQSATAGRATTHLEVHTYTGQLLLKNGAETVWSS